MQLHHPVHSEGLAGPRDHQGPHRRRAASAADTPTVVVASRGGGYGPGTSRESFEFVQTYLDKVLNGALGLEVDFVVPELTLARVSPAMADLIELSDASCAEAHEEAAAKAEALAARVAA